MGESGGIEIESLADRVVLKDRAAMARVTTLVAAHVVVGEERINCTPLSDGLARVGAIFEVEGWPKTG